MSKGYVATTTSFTNAKPSQVWEGITNLAIIKQHLFGTDVITDWKVGSPIIYKGAREGKNYEDKGTIL
jgi:hypothetical protein